MAILLQLKLLSYVCLLYFGLWLAIPYTMKILIKFYNQIRLVKDYLYQLSVTIMIVACNKKGWKDQNMKTL